jgi:transcriptional regulator with XRE-family HTH domain
MSMTVKKKKRPARVETQPTPMEKTLRDAVKGYGSNRRLAAEAGIGADQLSRFLRNERTLRLDTAGKLAGVLGLALK